jgi:uncharacterized protein DUF3738
MRLRRALICLGLATVTATPFAQAPARAGLPMVPVAEVLASIRLHKPGDVNGAPIHILQDRFTATNFAPRGLMVLAYLLQPGELVGAPARLLSAVGIAAVVSGVVVAVSAQTPASPAFEVASVKENKAGGPSSGTHNMPGGRVEITNKVLRDLVRTAYGSNDLDVVGGPDWIDTTRWDIVAAPLTPPTFE